MMQKYRISTDIGKDQLVTVQLKQDFDLLEILSLKFTQQDVYTSLCADYGVVCGRLTANDGYGIPNARVSIFIPLSTDDENDPVISALYPYKQFEDVNENGYRYNLLPSRKQHTGHTPTGTFPDQIDILSREEYMEVYEKYYKYTVKTNDAGDFMIWGVPVGSQTLHIDLDLSDMGCQSLAPYDLIYEGVSEEKFDNKYTYMASTNIDGLPQILTFDKTIEVYPFWGNQDLCEIGISRVDFDLKERGVRIEPYALLMGSSFTDGGGDNLGVNCNVDNQMGEKCRLVTSKGNIEAIRFSGEYEKLQDGTPNIDRPILEKFAIDSKIDEKGVFFFRVPMNLHYIKTDPFGNIVESKDPNVGIPTSGNYRFRFTLFDDSGASVAQDNAKVLVPNVREYHINDTTHNGAYGSIDPKSYSFSTDLNDYPTDAIKEIAGTSDDAINDGRRGIPQDYFYQFRYNRLYTVSQFINKYYKTSSLERIFSFFVKDKAESFIGIKEIAPNAEDDCPTTINYFPINDAVRNYRFNFFIITILNFIEWIVLRIQLFFKEVTASTLFAIAELLSDTGVSNKAAAKMFKRAKEFQFNATFHLNLITYPDCYDCSEDTISNQTQIYIPALDPATVTGGTASATNFYMTERYAVARQLGTCDKYAFTNGTAVAISVPYNNCDNNLVSANVPGNSTINVCGKPSQTFSITGITSSVTVNGCSGPSGANPDDDLYFENGFVPTNIPSINSSPKDGDYLYQQYVVEVDILGSGSTYISAGIGQSYPIVYDGNTSEWKIRNAYGLIRETISVAFNTPSDTPVGGTCHSTDGIVLVKHIWFAGNVDPSSVSSTEVESGCQKYDTIIEDDRGKTGDMRLQGIILPLVAGGQTYNTYVDAKSALKAHRPPSSYLGTSPALYDVRDINYNDTIMGTNIPDCVTRPPYNVGAVASVYGKWPTNINGGFQNETTRCIYKGQYYGAVKKRGPYMIDPDLTESGTLSGFSEFRDGVFTIIPLAGKTGELINAYRRRKLFGKLMCAGVTSYVFTNSWLNGALYFFRFNKRGTNTFCKDCVYKKTESDGTINFYYRSTPYDKNYAFTETQPDAQTQTLYDQKAKGFYGQTRAVNLTQTGSIFLFYNVLTELIGGTKTKREINFPTSVVDLGPRLTWINEICIDASLDVNCSISRSIGTSSYKGIDDLMEYVIQSKEVKEKGALDVQNLFDSRGYGQIDGDVAQLLNFNTQVGIYPFEYETSNSPYTALYANLFDGKGAVGVNFVYSEDDPNTVILESRGDLVRRCLNTAGRLGDNSQKVPYYMWDTYGHGFGEIGGTESTKYASEVQSYFTGKVYTQRLQEFKANLNPDPNQDPTDNIYFDPYILPPIRDCIEVNGVKSKTNDNYKEYKVNGQIRHLMELGGPFHYYFGLRKRDTAFDKFVENFGPK